uniref:Uncharacterized AAA domain-containing protein ycf46 n=1 Tax=Eucheuma denticulatum TaxID=305493 RepID=A0A8E7UEF8_9FLOR|nr:hypothetical protein [Eucheuma denticulatum]
MQFEKNLKLLISSRHLFIYVLSNEEERFEYVLHTIADSTYINKIYCWNFIDGYQNDPNYLAYAKKNPLAALELIDNIDSVTPKIFLLKDFNLFINDISIIRKIKNLFHKFKNSNLHIIILASAVNIPKPLVDIIAVLDFPLPSVSEILIELQRLFCILEINSYDNIENLALAYKGMSIDFVRKSMAKFVSMKITLSQIFSLIADEKKQFIQQTNILDFCPVNHCLDDIGGLFFLKQWLQKRSNVFSSQAKSYGLPVPKGILLVGIQGTGKSLSAKVIAQQWQLPLFRLDVGKIFGGVVGESENNMRSMIKWAENLAPCVLWIDEIDKVFSRLNSNTDSGTSNRVLSTLLVWLSEKNKNVFVVATANDILCLPSELLRKGRFDEIFFLDLPNMKERYKIFQIHLKKIRPLTWKQYNIDYFSELTENFSGAEIKQSIIEAMHNAFYEKRDFNSEDIISAISELIPLAFTDQATVLSMQQWAKLGKVRLASK